MSSTSPSKRTYTPNTLPSGKGILTWLNTVFTTTVGMKVIVAVTGTILVGYVIVHLIGNLKIFAGPDSINSYAKFLKDQGPFLWTLRIGLLTVFVLHILFAIRVKSRSAAARPIGYHYSATIQTSAASRFMLMTGLVILAFVVFHLAHYTLAVVVGTQEGVNYLDLKDASGRHDVYRMMIAGFSSPVICLFYLVAQIVLFFHLSHGIGSVFQTLGLNSPRMQRAVKKFSYGVAFLILLGNSLIVIGVWAGWVK
jgi:succinate dehydrogenase / fumarate reductase, cytochrome b subunit